MSKDTEDKNIDDEGSFIASDLWKRELKRKVHEKFKRDFKDKFFFGPDNEKNDFAEKEFGPEDEIKLLEEILRDNERSSSSNDDSIDLLGEGS